MSQKAVFIRKRHDNKISKVKHLLSRNFVVVAQSPKMEDSFSTPNFGDRDRGGVKTYRRLEGGNSPESCPSKTWTFDPQIGDCL